VRDGREGWGVSEGWEGGMGSEREVGSEGWDRTGRRGQVRGGGGLSLYWTVVQTLWSDASKRAYKESLPGHLAVNKLCTALYGGRIANTSINKALSPY
jgi:hypothetical protein